MDTLLLQLDEYQEKLRLIDTTSTVLNWDQNCIMPPNAAQFRGKQLAFMRQLEYEILTSKKFLILLDKCEKMTQGLDQDHSLRINLLKIRKKTSRIARISLDLIKDLAECEATTQSAWEHAKKENSFALFAPSFTRMVQLTRKKAEIFTEYRTPYDALLDDFDPGCSSEQLDTIFNPLKDKLVALIQNINHGGPRFAAKALGISVPIPIQKELAMRLARELGFDSDDGVLYTSSHPFSSTLGPADYRITTRYSEENFLSSFLAVAHEVGHALYEKSAPKDQYYYPIGQISSMGLHESQSLFYEKRIVSAKGFLHRWLPIFKECIPNFPSDMTELELFASFNSVKSSLNRVEADEVSYPMHIMIRYDLEKMLINQELAPEKIPALWQERYTEYLGLTPPDDASGALQDIHWACGMFGYFPSYALGHFISAQISIALASSLGPLDPILEAGRIETIRTWLNTHVHRWGSTFTAAELVEKITGDPLSTQSYVDYLTNKYQELYYI